MSSFSFSLFLPPSLPLSATELILPPVTRLFSPALFPSTQSFILCSGLPLGKFLGDEAVIFLQNNTQLYLLVAATRMESHW